MLLVTGITGHSGIYFLKELIHHKYDGIIRCIVRRNSDTKLLDNCGLKIETVYGDLNDHAFLEACMAGVDVVFHIAGIQKTLNVIEPALRNNVKRVFVVHTTGIFSNFKSASEEYKNIEQQLKMMIADQIDQISLIILRPTMIYGDLRDLNMSKFIKMIDKLRIFPIINHGAGLIQPVNARDLGKAYYQILMCTKLQNDEYVLSGEKPIKMIDAFELISNNLGKKTLYLNVPLGIGVFLARILLAVTLGKVDYVEKVQRMSEDRSFSHEDALRDFGYDPMPFDAGIKVEVEQYLEATDGKCYLN